MSCTKKEPSTIPGLERIPVLKYLKEPAGSIGELYERYPDGGEYGWFAFVYALKSFAYWEPDTKKWALLHLGSENVNQIRFMIIEKEKESMSPREEQLIKVLIYDGYNRDVTGQYSQVDLERDSGDYYTDQNWNNQHGRNKGFEFTITFEDLNFRQDRMSTKFLVFARRGQQTLVNDFNFSIN